MTWTNNSEIKNFLTCWKKDPKLCCLIFGKCSNLPPEKEQSPTWIWFKIHECSNHQPENMKKQSPTILNFSLWFLANKFFIVGTTISAAVTNLSVPLIKLIGLSPFAKSTQASTETLINRTSNFRLNLNHWCSANFFEVMHASLAQKLKNLEFSTIIFSDVAIDHFVRLLRLN